jgi:3-oxoacyl-[acyl-carrier protein] reductase
MDLGIKGRKAIVCASSQGLGKACAISLAREGCSVVINGRTENSLADAAQEIKKLTGADVITVKADINTDEGRKSLIDACPDADILVNNNSGPAPGKIEDWDHAAWLSALESICWREHFSFERYCRECRRESSGASSTLLQPW